MQNLSLYLLSLLKTVGFHIYLERERERSKNLISLKCKMKKSNTNLHKGTNIKI